MKPSTPDTRPASYPGSVSRAKSGSGSGPAPSSWLARNRWPAILTTAFVVIATLFSYLGSLGVRGTELNSATWQVRDFSFYRDPFTNTQFTGVKYSAPAFKGIFASATGSSFASVEPAIAVHLQNKLNAQSRWDMVELTDLARSKGSADILYELLHHTSGASYYWRDWTTRHNKKAKILWPAVQILSVFNLYAKIPPLMEITFEDLDESEFRQRVGSFIQTEILAFCSAETEPAMAQLAASAALRYGDNPQLQPYASASPPTAER